MHSLNTGRLGPPRQDVHVSVEGSPFLLLHPTEEGEGVLQVGGRMAQTEGSHILPPSLNEGIPAFRELGT